MTFLTSFNFNREKPTGGISGTSWTFLTCLAFLGVSKAAKEKAGELNSRQNTAVPKEDERLGCVSLVLFSLKADFEKLLGSGREVIRSESTCG
ncbi:MAG: hypothetical protein JW883_04400 [Deltaproteobacteria bacterium]|nr:hypothetical protein [Deltaproteobacteria bacterium]